MLENKKNALTLTFVNALVEDLSLELFGLSEVRTLHGFARDQLVRTNDEGVSIFPKLSKVIGQDAVLLLGSEVEFDAIFHKRADSPEAIEFYRKRRVYYEHYSFSDVIYGAVLLFEKRQDAIPKYSQVVVDEFQDFNALEVSLIELLASKSPVLLAGDDDQALYENLKSASADHIRQRYSGTTPGYESFKLPYCSRSTRVIVDATNDIVSSAMKCDCLQGRIAKHFIYFPDPKKDKESHDNPHLVHARVYAKQIPWFVQKRIKEIAGEVRDKFTVLLISPTRTQSREIVQALREKGFQNIRSPQRQAGEEPTLLEGLSLLLSDGAGNLGWRIVARERLPDSDFNALLKKTADPEQAPRFGEIVPRDLKREMTELLKPLRAVRDDKVSENEEDVAGLLKSLGVDTIAMGAESIRSAVKPLKRGFVDHALRNVPITATTIPSSKGLAADYVFITHFDDRYFIKRGEGSPATDEEICSFLVAVTRARRKVYLVSSNKKSTPTFLKWIDPSRISTIE